VLKIPPATAENKAHVELKEASFKWKTQDEAFALSNVSLTIDRYLNV